MRKYVEKIVKTADYLKSNLPETPRIGLLTGTGLGGSVEAIDVIKSFKYKEIESFPVSTVESHIGKLYFGRLKGKMVVAFQGRFHLYEGYSPLEVTFPIRIMKELGVEDLILSNAAGGLNPNYSPGDIMIIKDHINLTGSNPLVGENIARWGERFPDMTKAYAPRLLNITEEVSEEKGIRVHKGVYAGLKGPSLETPAEIRFLRTIGGDAVGFSTIQEVIAAVHSGINVLGLSIITNVHDADQPIPASVEEIIAIAEKTVPKLKKIISFIVESI